VQRLERAVAIVTGATRGVGRGCALELALAGATVYATGRTLREGDSPYPGSLESLVAEAEKLGGRVVGVICDHRDDAQVASLFERIDRDRGRLDVLVNNAFLIPDGVDPNAPFWAQPLRCWDEMLDVGTRSAYVASWLAAPRMVRHRRGLIANISSPGARYFYVHPAYGAGKAALDRLTRDTAHQLAPHGVAAVALWPYFVLTERLQRLDPVEWGLDLKGAESLRFTGRAVAALAADPDVLRRAGRSFTTRQLAQDYGFADLDGTLPDGAPLPAEPDPVLPPPRM
jgi:NAD(P)-dependent dehydrogenase (short-subunit alcohol dehydrogenase family)